MALRLFDTVSLAIKTETVYALNYPNETCGKYIHSVTN